ncbi:hypothetical protein [Nonomuraea jiangxiensis]|uniref:PknH-like extracellular domain-containing protein n=1 Tax=Nonomuraea jiangxiensis TaxID=633440 RepID=A0A1G9JD67_9ACTN|nr:hypothetical protein [Nonomuraea jiangxiensis]SDL35519.1 PknH-like extracellular domain-containing protein [Nonomuraea jiangxiensis]
MRSIRIMVSVGAAVGVALCWPGAGTASAATDVPKGFLIYERADRPRPVVTVDGRPRWRVVNSAHGILWVNPCQDAGLGTKGRIAVRRAWLEAPAAAQMEEVALYRDVSAARKAMTDLRAALRRCAKIDDGAGDGRDVRWTGTPARIGDEALQVAMQAYHGTRPTIHGQRAVVARKGSAVFLYAHTDETSRAPSPADFRRHASDAVRMARLVCALDDVCR